MGHADTLALDGVDPHRGRVQQQVDDVVVEEVDLVDVEDRAVGRGQQTGLEAASPLAQGRLHVEGSGDAVLSGSHRQLDHGHPDGARLGHGLGQSELGSVNRILLGGQVVGPGNLLVLREQGRQATHRRGLRGSFLAADEHPGQIGADRGEDEGQLHLLLSDDGAEGVDGALCHVSGPFGVGSGRVGRRRSRGRRHVGRRCAGRVRPGPSRCRWPWTVGCRGGPQYR